MKYSEIIAEASAPARLFHGTFQHHLASIREHGLGGKFSRRNFDISGSGVYLVDDPDVAEHWAADNEFGNQGEVVVLSVDTSDLDLSTLTPDTNDEGERGGTSYHYRGVIPASALSTITESLKRQ
jgi:RNA:NAD 2'-phosphotransferase (TPT1/KptA family)